MAVQYRLYQNNNSRSGQYQKWYARAVMIDTVDTNALAEQIEANCTVKRADVLAVISELVVVMKQALQDSKRVKLDNFGSFKLGLTTAPSDTAKDFTAAQNVKDVHVLFQPRTDDAPAHSSTGARWQSCPRTPWRTKPTRPQAGNNAS